VNGPNNETGEPPEAFLLFRQWADRPRLRLVKGRRPILEADRLHKLLELRLVLIHQRFAADELEGPGGVLLGQEGTEDAVHLTLGGRRRLRGVVGLYLIDRLAAGQGE